MYIEEVSIDGFKSYAKRVVVKHFDPSFNAITGLNGSGKSNILDALCFVLGIKNLNAVCFTACRKSCCLTGPTDSPVVHQLSRGPSAPSLPPMCATRRHYRASRHSQNCIAPAVQVRAGSLLDLVYKQGQAGVTKATVSVTFNNENELNMPQGYGKDKKKIVVTRQARISTADLRSCPTATPVVGSTRRALWIALAYLAATCISELRQRLGGSSARSACAAYRWSSVARTST